MVHVESSRCKEKLLIAIERNSIAVVKEMKCCPRFETSNLPCFFQFIRIYGICNMLTSSYWMGWCSLCEVELPGVAVLMPLKGSGEHNLHNWRTQDNVDARIFVAGPSTTCSQKIHNQLLGVEKVNKDNKYVLFLDDDVRLHPGSIGVLTVEMEKNPEIFIQTGYPLDLPSGSLGSYCIYEYHMPCSMRFATGGRTFFLWGGCMMMHADDFRTFCDGGYSDDMTLAAIAGAHKRLIITPPVAVFPHPFAVDNTFSRFEIC